MPTSIRLLFPPPSFLPERFEDRELPSASSFHASVTRFEKSDIPSRARLFMGVLLAATGWATASDGSIVSKGLEGFCAGTVEDSGANTYVSSPFPNVVQPLEGPLAGSAGEVGPEIRGIGQLELEQRSAIELRGIPLAFDIVGNLSVKLGLPRSRGYFQHCYGVLAIGPTRVTAARVRDSGLGANCRNSASPLFTTGPDVFLGELSSQEIG